MRVSGARLVEVGTTNRTRVADYRDAITDRTALILKVHLSNFRQVGFIEEAPLAELAGIAHQHGVVLLHDLGSGSLLPSETVGLAHEPTVQESLAGGADLVAFSGDKLLGGPQAGIVVGYRELVTRLGRNPLYRALRPDKLTLAALDATLSSYLRGTAQTDLPLWRMLQQDAATTSARAEAWADRLRQRTHDVEFEIVPVQSTAGGGSLPEDNLPGFGLALRASKTSATALAKRLRAGEPGIVALIRDRRVVLDPRTVLQGSEEEEMIDALIAALR
jgi:L-seryl-tRNA(Ser) seleniumtransferase